MKNNVRFEFQYEEDGARHYSVEAIHVTVTGNNRKYTQEELSKAAVSLSARPININHDKSLWLPHNTYDPLSSQSNSTEYMEFDSTTKAVKGTLQIVDKDVQEMIDNNKITKLSIEQVPWHGETSQCSIDGCIHEQRGIMFTGIALLTSDVTPGDKTTKISRESKYDDVLEKLRKKWGWKEESVKKEAMDQGMMPADQGMMSDGTCPPGHHMMPDGHCMPDSEMPKGAEASYPWDQCIADAMDQYGDMDIANKVCGSIKAKYGGEKLWYARARAEAIRAVGEPFANYKDFEDCVNQNADKQDPNAYCATIKMATEVLKPKTECQCVKMFGAELAAELAAAEEFIKTGIVKESDESVKKLRTR